MIWKFFDYALQGLILGWAAGSLIVHFLAWWRRRKIKGLPADKIKFKGFLHYGCDEKAGHVESWTCGCNPTVSTEHAIIIHSEFPEERLTNEQRRKKTPAKFKPSEYN